MQRSERERLREVDRDRTEIYVNTAEAPIIHNINTLIKLACHYFTVVQPTLLERWSGTMNIIRIGIPRVRGS